MKRKRLLSALLAIAMISSLLPAGALAQTGDTTGLGSYVVRLVTDPDTSAKPAEFGTADADGAVWTDKSVTVNGSNFGVTLSALAQEYIRTSTSTSTTSIAADVLFVLDVTGSMLYPFDEKASTYAKVLTDTRAYGMVEAVNQAMTTVLSANPNNRVAVTTFANNTAGTLLPLDHYTTGTVVPATADGAAYNKYLEMTVTGPIANDGKTKIKNVSTLKGSNGNSYTSSVGVRGGTNTQHGVYYGANYLKQQIAATSPGNTRIPFVLILTDGDANSGSSNWTNTFPSSGGSISSDYQYAGYAVLTAAYRIDLLTDAYNSYNDYTAEKDKINATVFNVGVSVGESNNTVAGCIMKPQLIADATAKNNSGTVADKTKYLIENNATAKSLGYTDSSKYVFSDYVSFTDSAVAVAAAFNQLGELVKSSSQAVTTPITSVGAGDAAANVVFTDVLGEGMELKGAPKLGGVAGTAAGAGYDFAGSKSKVAYNSGSRTLTWTLPAEELPLILFSDRQNPTGGNYANSSEPPLQLTYSVGLSSSTDLAGAYYSNAYTAEATAAASFAPAGDNPYYYDVTEASNEAGYTSTQKEAPAASNKATNTTKTAAYVQSHKWDEAGNGMMHVALGNNGKLTPQLSLTKSVNKASVAAGKPVTYTITVTNPTSAAIYGVTVTDEVPAVMTGITRVSNHGSASGNTITWTGLTIPANGSLALTFDATLSATASTDITYNNTANITAVGNTALATAATVTGAGVTMAPTFTATVNVKVGNSAADITSILNAGTKLYLKVDGGNEYVELSHKDTGEYTANASNGTYHIYSDTGNRVGTGALTISGADNATTLQYYSLNYVMDGGVPAIEPQYRLESGNVTISSTTPMKTGYIFGGWKAADGTEYKPGDTISINANTTLTAMWVEATNVQVNVTIKHEGGGGADSAEDMRKVTVALFDGGVKKGSQQLDGSGQTDTTTALTYTFTDLPKSDNYTVDVTKSGYSATVTKDEDQSNLLGYDVFNVVLDFNPNNFNINFTVNMEDTVPKDLYPQQANVKVTCWYNPGTGTGWNVISQHTGASYAVTLDPESGTGTGAYPVWKHESGNEAALYYYRMDVVSFVMPDGTVVAAAEQGNDAVTYKSENNFYTAVVTVADGYVPGAGTTLEGVYYDGQSAAQAGTLEAVVSVAPATVIFDAKGGKIDGAETKNVPAFQIPNLSDYEPTRDGGYVFQGWYTDANYTTPAVTGTPLMTNENTTLYAKWAEPVSIGGEVTIAWAYNLGEGMSYIPVDERPTTGIVQVQRKTADDTSWAGADDRTITYTAGDLTTDSDIQSYSFTDLPAYAPDGVTPYEYRVVVTQANYETTYEPDTGIAAFYNGSAEVNAELTFQPGEYNAPYEVDAAAIAEGFRPTNADVVILFNTANQADGWGVISQHIPTGIAVPITDGGGGGAYPVWNYTFDGNTYYFYKLRLDKYTMAGSTADYTEATAPFTVTYEGVSQAADNPVVMKAILNPKTYNLTFNTNTDDEVNMDGAPASYEWSHGLGSLPTPTRDGYAFDGWVDSEGTIYTSIPADSSENLSLTATWTEASAPPPPPPPSGNDAPDPKPDYSFTTGKDSVWSPGNSPLNVNVNGPQSKFVEVLIDGKPVNPADYTLSSPLTSLTLKDSLLASLGVGEHTITVVYTNGEASTTLHILPNVVDVPKTGDPASPLPWMLMGLLALLASAMAATRRKEKRR